ncbi:hypothetical protein [Yoonia sp. I 8.24]|uniref:hypothetical protein n=1 Tax=Yoonia sp. I 8.24 TaxID=1537229 RepID=UPI001EDE5B8A|nr:hypothetical protein [Yoonia sp. I 8.24]
MSDVIDQIRARIKALEAELDDEIARHRRDFKYQIQQRRIVFERDIQKQHAAVKQRLASYLSDARPLVVLTAPVIYAMIIPFVLLDVFVTIYQTVCFPVYRIQKVKRSDYITFDRKHLAYLNGLEKFNCLYCSYGNGLLAYAREIAGRTEKHWCPIKHAKRMDGMHPHYPDFLEFGDAEGYQKTKQASHDSTK